VDGGGGAGDGHLLAARASADAPSGAEAAQARVALDCGEEGAPEWADVLAVGPRPGAVEVAVVSARRAQRAVRAGGVWAFAYHLVALPCAASGQFSPIVAVGGGGAAAHASGVPGGEVGVGAGNSYLT
jgi:cation transport ATPase